MSISSAPERTQIVIKKKTLFTSLTKYKKKPRKRKQNIKDRATEIIMERIEECSEGGNGSLASEIICIISDESTAAHCCTVCKVYQSNKG